MKTKKEPVKWLALGIGLILLLVVIYYLGRLTGDWMGSPF